MGKHQCPPFIGILQAEDIDSTVCVQNNSFSYGLQPMQARQNTGTTNFQGLFWEIFYVMVSVR